MKRSRAFILSEQLMTIMLQASFILVLCASFYQLISFYTRTQQVLTARNHAERVISFMDDKIRNAGLGLWRCKSSAAIRGKLTNIDMLHTQLQGGATPTKGYKWPVALKWYGDGIYDDAANDVPLLSISQNSGDVLTVLYAKRNPTTGNQEAITAFEEAKTLANNTTTTLRLLDRGTSGNPAKVQSLFDTPSSNNNIKNYAVMESLGVPMWIECVYIDSKIKDKGNVDVRVYGLGSSETITVPAAGDLMTINCMQMFVHGTTGTGEGRQFAFRELTDGGKGWDKTYNQEKGILDIYMEVDRMHNIFTLWVLATGGYDASMSNPRPDSWPKEANPAGNNDDDAKEEWLKTDYCHHIVYVSRASWKLNNIPQGFTWD